MSDNQLRSVLPDGIGQLVLLEGLVLEGNMFIAPVPRSISNLTRLHDFSCFKKLPDSLHAFPNRGFKKKEWHRQYVWAATAGNNSLIWEHKADEDGFSGYPNPTRGPRDTEAFWLFGRRAAAALEREQKKALEAVELAEAAVKAAAEAASSRPGTRN